MQRYESGEWELVYPSVLDEARRVLRFLRRQGGRIDVADRRLLVDECGPGYDGYRRWPTVVRDARRWNVLFT
jgi:hypothetical protein